MKSFLKKLWTVVAILGSSICAHAYTFSVGNIHYDEISSTTVCVTSADKPINGDTIEIPSMVRDNNGTQYTVTEISSEFFCRANRPLVLKIPASIEVIRTGIQGNYGGYTFFYGLLSEANLSSIVVSPDNPNYSSRDGVLFSKDFTILYRYPKGSNRKSYTVPEGVIEIFDRAVTSADRLEYVEMPNSVRKINNSAFASCDNLHEIKMSESVQIIHTDAFEDCPISSDIILPETLEYIGDDAFGWHGGDYAGVTVKCHGTTPPKLLQYKGDEQPFADSTLMFGELHVPKGAKHVYSIAPGWSGFKYIYDDLEEDESPEELVSTVILSGPETFSVELLYPQGFEAAFTIHETVNWRIYSVIYNGVDVTGEMKDHTFITPPLEGENTLHIIMASRANLSEDTNLKKIEVVREGGYIHLFNLDKSEEFAVYDVKGHLVYQGREQLIYVPERGVYLIRVDGIVLKLFI